MAELPASVPLVVLASACWDSPSRVNCHEIARRFAARGHQVLFVESTGLRAPALRASSHDRRRTLHRPWSWLRGARRVEPNLFVVSPLALPWSGGDALRRRSLAWLARSVERAMSALRLERPILYAFLPTHLEAVRRLDARLSVYHCVDHYAENPGVDGAWIDSLERRLLAEIDVVFAASRVLRERLRKTRSDVVLLENVADVEPFTAALDSPVGEPEDLRDCDGVRVVYVGNLARYRVDLDFLLTAARRHPELCFALIGVIGQGDVERGERALHALLAQPNVKLLGPRPHARLPGYLRHCDVAIIPFLDNGHTRGSLPLKLWEYLAAGLSVVATDLPNLRALELGDAVTLVRDPEAFAHAVARAGRAARAAGLDGRRVRSRLARGHGWAARIAAIETLLAERMQRRGDGATAAAAAQASPAPASPAS